MMMGGIKKGDLVYVTSTVLTLVRNEEIATKAIVLRKIPDDWYRICMTWGQKSKIFDCHGHMLRKVSDNKCNET